MSLAGKTVLITGSTNGIGKETAFQLAEKGARIVMACRNVKLAQQVADEIHSRHPHATVVVGPPLDLRSMDSVHAFAQHYLEHDGPIHILINNAGAFEADPYYTPEGVGGLCQVNYLGPFTLTRLLERRIIQSAPSRIVTVSSVTHRFSSIGPPTTFLTNWKQGSNYGNSKLANVLFAFEMERRMEQAGIDNVHSCAVDPGAVASSIWNNQSMFRKGPINWVIRNLYAPNEEGAKAVVHAATVPWEVERQKAREISDAWNVSQRHDRSGEDVRFYARGMFAWPTITSLRGRVLPPRERGLVEKARHWAYSLSALFHSMADWPVRQLSRGVLASTTSPVPAAPLAYDAALARALWDVSCETAGVPRDITPFVVVDNAGGTRSGKVGRVNAVAGSGNDRKND